MGLLKGQVGDWPSWSDAQPQGHRRGVDNVNLQARIRQALNRRHNNYLERVDFGDLGVNKGLHLRFLSVRNGKTLVAHLPVVGAWDIEHVAGVRMLRSGRLGRRIGAVGSSKRGSIVRR